MAWQENQPNYFDNTVAVRLPHEDIYKDSKALAAMSGPVVTYNLRDREKMEVSGVCKEPTMTLTR